MTAEVQTLHVPPSAPKRPYSLKWQLIRRLFLLQSAMLATLGVVFAFGLWMIGLDGLVAPGEDSVDAVAGSLTWTADGTMTAVETDALRQERARTAQFWFLARDGNGRTISSGPVPAGMATIAASGINLTESRFNGRADDPDAIAGRMKIVATPHGPVTVYAGWRGPLPPQILLWRIALVTFTLTWPGILVIGIITIAVTPFVARGVHRSLDDAASAARRIDYDHRGYRLPTGSVPAEIVPLISAMNGSLARLDEGYDRQKRFLLTAAHELRTPIAILQTRLEGMQASRDTTLLLEDVARLATFAEQLLDLERLSRHDTAFGGVDIVDLARRQAAELAPLIIAAGYEADFRAQPDIAPVNGDATSLERAIANLVQNAIRHGGRQGTITIGVAAPAQIFVSDQGPGIPAAERERIFEAFQRVGSKPEGTGLGLHLVQEIVRIHGGRVSVDEAPAGGARFVIDLPPGRPA